MAANPAQDWPDGWRAALDLELAFANDRTRIAAKRHSGPLCIQKPFYPGDDSCHVYLLHPPGGLAGGDALEVGVRVGSRAAALLTMPASTKFYRSAGRTSSLVNTLAVAADGVLEWLPPETILFGGANAQMATRVELAAGARFIGWEALVLGRPKSGDHFDTGTFEQRFELYVDGRPLLLERMAAQAHDALLEAQWGWAANSVSATMLAYPADAAHVAAVREVIAGGRPDVIAGPGPDVAATLVDDLLVIRALAPDVLSLRPLLDSSWRALRQPLLGRPAHVPRIWNT